MVLTKNYTPFDLYVTLLGKDLQNPNFGKSLNEFDVEFSCDFLPNNTLLQIDNNLPLLKIINTSTKSIGWYGCMFLTLEHYIDFSEHFKIGENFKILNLSLKVDN